MLLDSSEPQDLPITKLHLAQIFDVSPVPMMVLDRALRFQACNDAHVAMVGRSRDEMLGRYVFDVFPETQDRVDALLTIFKRALDGETISLEATPFALIENGQRREYWWAISHMPLRDENGEIVGLVQFSENVTEQVRLKKLNEAIMGELHHRIGNIFTVIGALARQVARTSVDIPEFMSRFEGKIENLVHGQKSLDSKLSDASSLGMIVKNQLGVYLKFASERIAISGPDVQLSPSQAKAVSMVVHELATNALKYGAIKSETGTIAITWTLDPSGRLRFSWVETGGDVADETAAPGYGQRLLTEILPRQLNGHAARTLDDTGLRYELDFRPAS